MFCYLGSYLLGGGIWDGVFSFAEGSFSAYQFDATVLSAVFFIDHRSTLHLVQQHRSERRLLLAEDTQRSLLFGHRFLIVSVE